MCRQRAESRLRLEIAELPQCDLIKAVRLSGDRFHEVPPSQSRIFRGCRKRFVIVLFTGRYGHLEGIEMGMIDIGVAVIKTLSSR
jgi:hypothetical protein